MTGRESRVARAWRIALAHMSGGEIPMDQLDFAQAPTKDIAEQDAEIDRSAEESFPASDPPSSSRSHA